MVMGMPDESDPGMSAGGTRDISGSKTTMKILGDLGLVGLSFLPVGAAIRGGQLVYKGMQGAKAAKELRKLKAVQSAIKAQKPAPGTSTTITAPKPKVRVPAGKPKPAPKAADKPKPTPPRAPGLAKNRQRVDGKPTAAKPAPKPAPKPKPKPTAKKSKTTRADRALAAATTAALVSTAVEKSRRDSAGTKRKPTGTYERRAVETSKPKRKPTGTYERKAVETSKPKKVERKPSGPQTRGSQKRGATKIVTAGKNVGFGPKGNIFPKDAADRRRLMAKYGGTGSAAAKAAAAGKQGNLRKKK